ncbi:MAG TPA: carboxypeptidase regulatory-like domain-containing protein [Pyrinomonadaceae bacterium]
MFLKRTRFWVVLILIVSLLALGSSCRSDEDEDELTNDNTTDAPQGKPYVSKGNEGTIKGLASLTGDAPAPKPIDMNADPACASKNPNAVAEDVVVKDGKIEYVFVYVKEGQLADGQKVGGLSFPSPATPVVLDQDGCHYKPHVLGIQTNQKFQVKNSDPTAHNVNVQPKGNTAWNQSQPPNAPVIEKSFTRAETLIPIKCNQHPWMKAWVGVLKHPFFAVTKEDGSFEITGVPPGKYTVVAWHEKYGEKTAEVTVGDKATATADFAFASTATASAGGGSLEILPALDIPMLAHH